MADDITRRPVSLVHFKPFCIAIVFQIGQPLRKISRKSVHNLDN